MARTEYDEPWTWADTRYLLWWLASRILAPLVLVAGLFFGIAAIVVELEDASCTRVASQSSYDTKYAGGTYYTRSCYVQQHDGNWVPLDKWRGIDE